MKDLVLVVTTIVSIIFLLVDATIPHPPSANDVTLEGTLGNKKKGSIVLTPIAFNIYYGSTGWNTAKINIIDNLAKNIGASPYWGTVQTLLDGPTGKPAQPLVFKGSAWDNSVVPGQTGIDPASIVADFVTNPSNFVTNIFQGYVASKKIKVAGDFDIVNYNLDNTVFTLMLSPDFDFTGTPSWCGFHGTVTFLYNGVNTVDLKIAVVLYGNAATQVVNCNYYQLGRSIDGVAIDPVSPNGDGNLDTLASTWTSVVVGSVVNPGGSVSPSWVTTDDDHYVGTTYPFTKRGGYEGPALCAGTFGSNPAFSFNSNNPPSNLPNGKINSNILLPVTIGGGSPYYLLQQQYVLSPPNSQCAMTVANLPALVNGTAVHYLSVYNAFNSTKRYSVALEYTYTDQRNGVTHVYRSPGSVGWRQHFEFGRFLANTVVTKILVYNAATNKVVYVQNPTDSGMPFVIDSANANLLLIWGACTTNCSTAAGHMLVGHFGYSGAAATILPRFVAVNAQFAAPTAATRPSQIVVRDASGIVRASAARTNTTAFWNPAVKAWAYYSMSRGFLTATPYAPASIAGYTVTLAATGKPLSASTTVPTPFSVRPGSVVWVIFAQSVGGPVVYQTALPPSGCMGTPSSIADGRCDAVNNVPACLFDGGDCCPSTCTSAAFTCGAAGYLCLAAAPPAPPPTALPAPASPTTATAASVLCVQTITGVTQSDAASPNFPLAVQQSVASALGVPVGYVSLPSVVYASSRARGLLAAGATATYTVNAPNVDPQALAAAVAAIAAAVTSLLRALGYPAAAAAAPTVVPNTPTSAPVAPPPTPRYTVAGTVTTNGAQAGACFAATEHVTLAGGATKAMSEVAVGDRILTVNAKTGTLVYSDVVAVPHGQNTVRTTFTVVATTAGRDLKVTANHMLPAGACALPAAALLPVVAASSVAVGDCVQTVSGREQVVSVSAVEGEGIYTAVAVEELLVVNGIVATPYGGVNPALANMYYNLHRLLYRVQPSTTGLVRWCWEATAASFWAWTASHDM